MEVKFKSSQILIDELLNLHRGQGLDIYWRLFEEIRKVTRRGRVFGND